MDAEVVIVIIILSIIAWLWFAMNRHIAKKANLVKEINVHTGPKLDHSSWRGRVRINGLYFKNSVKVVRYEQGCLLKLFPVFGGGKLWVPNKGLEVLEHDEAGWLSAERITIKSGDNRVMLSGNPANVFIQSLESNNSQ